jgi:hypothetical protein
MAALNFDCSIHQAYMFEKDSQVLVGHLTKLVIGSTSPITFALDTELTVATDLSKAKIVGPMSNISWNGGYADPVYIDANVSVPNQQSATLLTHTDLSDTTVVFQFNVYAYDPVAKKYYIAFSSNPGGSATDMNGLIMKQGGSLAFSIDSDQDMEVASPKNFRMSIGIMPQETAAQALQVAVSNTANFAKQWGVGMGA